MAVAAKERWTSMPMTLNRKGKLVGRSLGKRVAEPRSPTAVNGKVPPASRGFAPAPGHQAGPEATPEAPKARIGRPESHRGGQAR